MHYRIITVEGCDGTGKTTFAERLVAEYGFTVIHSSRTPEHIDLVDRYQQIIMRAGRLVLDRSFVSELVYGPLHRGRSRLTWCEAVRLARFLADHNGVFVYLTGSAAAIRARLLARDGPNSPDLGAVERLLAGYQRIFDAFAPHVPVIRIDIAQAGGSAD
ncbi:MAG: hypothetical protein ACRDQ5_06240 [Sciscionella sp.]